MSPIPRWLRPKSCDADGHQPESVERRGYARSCGHFRCVADKIVQTAVRCRRCGELDGEWETTRRSCLQGLTMETRAMERLDDEGILITDRPKVVR